jgi:dCMP deaminase
MEINAMGRISREVMFMDMARAASRRSTCFRRNVGAVVVHQNNPVSAGWNGQEPGAPHCTGNDCPGIVPGMCGTLHAEHNAMRVAVSLLRAPLMSICIALMHRAPTAVCSSGTRHSTFGAYSSKYHTAICLHLHHFSSTPIRRTWSYFRRTEVYEVTPAGYIVEHFRLEGLKKMVWKTGLGYWTITKGQWRDAYDWNGSAQERATHFHPMPSPPKR